MTVKWAARSKSAALAPLRSYSARAVPGDVQGALQGAVADALPGDLSANDKPVDRRDGLDVAYDNVRYAGRRTARPIGVFLATCAL